MENQLLVPLQLNKEVSEQIRGLFTNMAEEIIQKALNNVEVKPYMNKKETCEYIGISFNTLVKLQNAGLPIVMIDGIQMFRKVDIDEFFEKNRY